MLRETSDSIAESLSLRECRLLIEMPSLRIIASPWILERASRFFFEDVRIGMNRANIAKRLFCAIEYLDGEVAILQIASRSAHREDFLANSYISLNSIDVLPALAAGGGAGGREPKRLG